METITPDYKIITLGDTNVGKTSIIFRYTSEDYNPNQINTIGMDSKIKTIEIDSQKINLKIWDSAGQERFRSIQRYYYNKVDGVIFVYDITNKKSFSVIDSWIKEVNENINRNISFILVGNKTDLEESREVSIIEGEKFAKEKNFHFFECSAKNGICINEIFECLVKDILKKSQENKDYCIINGRENSFIINQNGVNNKKVKKKCCNN